jgi:hypothetical protein
MLRVTVALFLTAASLAAQPVIVSPDGTYLGRLSANEFDPESTSNPYGRYGSEFSPDSINNPFSEYGSEFSNKSANNPFATEAPIILDAR